MATMRLPAELPGEPATELPKIAGSRCGTVVIAASGPQLWDDLAALEGREFDLMAVNEAGIYIPARPQHWVSLHPEKFQWMLPLRRDVSFGPAGLHVGVPIHTHSVRACAGVMHVWPTSYVSVRDGGSGLAACRIALGLGYEVGILAGMPIDGSRHFFDPPGPQGLDFGVYLGAFRAAARNEFRGRIRSMSGKTRELLGAP